ncbi:hypothetical protein SEMRO_3703_G350500.1 [Seminavis robusta]|uniref:Uncharacterized protein n=1 Tax=Seminavis robusta TaxID=568900 RepID=A0A9N8F2Q8_9STRA|nr:hypothetical protein SEMRO_3703_G350500.1 [Seminavis robusta]|eukprot:Sro3703_g350500.1 n/a (151) ;mRNA; r:3061-3513
MSAQTLFLYDQLAQLRSTTSPSATDFSTSDSGSGEGYATGIPVCPSPSTPVTLSAPVPTSSANSIDTASGAPQSPMKAPPESDTSTPAKITVNAPTQSSGQHSPQYVADFQPSPSAARHRSTAIFAPMLLTQNYQPQFSVYQLHTDPPLV